jgi:hypothetical protein
MKIAFSVDVSFPYGERLRLYISTHRARVVNIVLMLL